MESTEQIPVRRRIDHMHAPRRSKGDAVPRCLRLGHHRRALTLRGIELIESPAEGVEQPEPPAQCRGQGRIGQ
jgi:hypothetical protein